MKVYIMPDGKKYQFADDKVPEGAVLASKKKKKVEQKKAEPKNKAKKPANKSKKADTK